MTQQQAREIIANEDYLPWSLVAQAKEVLGIAEPTAAQIWAEAIAKRAQA